MINHAKSEQHRVVMEHLRGERYKIQSSSALIVHLLIAMDQRKVSKMCLKFEEGVAFLKFPVFHSLAE